MKTIAFIDTEIDPHNRRILDIGSIKDNGSSFHSASVADFIIFLKGTAFICGHNIINHDLKYIQKAVNYAGINELNVIDTLFLSPLLFPTKPYHALLKDDKLQVEDKLYPLLWKFIIDISNNLRTLKDAGKSKFPDMYSEMTILDDVIIRRNLPDLVRSSW